MILFTMGTILNWKKFWFGDFTHLNIPSTQSRKQNTGCRPVFSTSIGPWSNWSNSRVRVINILLEGPGNRMAACGLAKPNKHMSAITVECFFLSDCYYHEMRFCAQYCLITTFGFCISVFTFQSILPKTKYLISLVSHVLFCAKIQTFRSFSTGVTKGISLVFPGWEILYISLLGKSNWFAFPSGHDETGEKSSKKMRREIRQELEFPFPSLNEWMNEWNLI